MLKIIEHPLIQIKLTKLRKKTTSHTSFTKNLNEISSLMAYEVLRDYKGKKIKVDTPVMNNVEGYGFDSEIVIVPILRAGLGMVGGIKTVIPQARIGHIGLYRDEKTLEIHEYFYKMPNVSKNDSQIIIVDPMLATGGSAIDAINRLKKDGYKNIKLVCLVAAPEGVKNVQEHFEDIDIFISALDEKLNEHKYIVPGLGDAGDRIFGTK